MDARPLEADDEALIDAATEVLAAHYEPGRHEVASALRTGSGAVYAAINLVTSVGTAGVHCEPITVGNAVLAGETDLEATVAVSYADPDARDEVVVLSACGVCRELLRDFDPEVEVIVPSPDGPVRAAVADLLPGKGSVAVR